MAVEIASLADEQVPATLGDLYLADGKSALIKNMIFTNTDSQARTLNVYFLKSGGSPGTDERRILAKDLVLPSGYSVVHDAEISLSDGDKIRGIASAADVIDYVINGVEREVV